jgi:hypothetical protein
MEASPQWGKGQREREHREMEREGVRGKNKNGQERSVEGWGGTLRVGVWGENEKMDGFWMKNDGGRGMGGLGK